MEQDWALIYNNTIEYKVMIVKDILQEEGIDSFIINKKDSAYGSFGEIELYCVRNNVLRASNIIKDIKFE